MKMLLEKSIKTFRNEGFGGFFKKAGAYINRKTKPFTRRVLVPYAKYKIKRFNPRETEIKILVDFVFDNFAGLICPGQVRSEITALAELVKELEPKTVLEIGTAEGGT